MAPSETVEPGIVKLSSDKYKVRVFLGRDPATNKVLHVSRTVTGGIRQARSVKKQLETESKAGKFQGRQTNLSALLDEWIKFGRQSKGWSEKHAAETTRRIETDVRPQLGHLTLDELTAKRLDDFYSYLRDDRGLSETSVLHYHRLLSAALVQAEKWDLVDRVATRKATPPKARRAEVPTPSQSEVLQMVRHAERDGSKAPWLADAIFIAATTGIRRGELCGLRWSDVDLLDGSLTVRRSIWENAGKTGDKDPKSHQVRLVPIGTATVARLEGRYAAASADAAKFGTIMSADAFVFSPSPDSSDYTKPDVLGHAFRRVIGQLRKATGQPWPYTLHSLRHYTATSANRLGAGPREAADRLGHADTSITLDVYTTTTSPQAKALAEALDHDLLGE